MSYRADKLGDGRTDRRTDGQTQATTIPGGQYWPRVNILRLTHYTPHTHQTGHQSLRLTSQLPSVMVLMSYKWNDYNLHHIFRLTCFVYCIFKTYSLHVLGFVKKAKYSPNGKCEYVNSMLSKYLLEGVQFDEKNASNPFVSVGLLLLSYFYFWNVIYLYTHMYHMHMLTHS